MCCKLSLSKKWFLVEELSFSILLLIYVIFPPSKFFDIYSKLSFIVIIYALYIQILTLNFIKLAEEKKKGLGFRWLSWNISSIKNRFDMPLTLITIGLAGFFSIQNNDTILLKMFGIVFLKDLLVISTYFNIIKEISKIVEQPKEGLLR
jgi:hypothetical protein